MTSTLLSFTPEDPCRCGFNGEGIHRCHTGRNPAFPGGRCVREAVPRLLSAPAALAGTQMKFSVVVACYCPECHVEAFPKATP